MSARARMLGTTLPLLVALASGCGGNVNLGGKGSEPGGLTDGGALNSAESPVFPQSEPVAKLAENFSLGTLAVAGEYLYFSGFDGKQVAGFYRCKKSKCDATRERLPNVRGSVFSLQAFRDRLGVANLEDGAYWLGSYALPDASDRRVAIADLPPSSATSPLFHDSFVYFSVDLEYGAYRCPLPDCNNTPKRIGSTQNDSWVNLQADGEVVFWTDGSFIYRAGAYGDELPRTLLPDATLSEAPADATVDASVSHSVVSIAVSDGWLYAAVTHSETGKPCDSFCPYRMQRWPVGGGEREILFDTEGMIRRVFVLDGELAWLDRSLRDPGNLDAAVLSTCRVEACKATRRDLGEVRPDFKALVGDEVDWYWLEAEPAVSQGLPNNAIFERQIRRAPRLPPP